VALAHVSTVVTTPVPAAKDLGVKITHILVPESADRLQLMMF
jgi:hypothetical protein